MNPAANNVLLIVLSAPPGGGKTTLCQQLLAANANVARVVTCTTRAPRGGERDGADYFFLTKEVFQQKVATNQFLEHANVYGNFYGTLKAEVRWPMEATAACRMLHVSYMLRCAGCPCMLYVKTNQRFE